MNSFLGSNAVWVLDGARLMSEGAFALDCEGRSTLIVTPPWDVERAAAQSFADETTGTSDLAAGLANVVKAYRVNPTRTISVGLRLLGQRLMDRIVGALAAMPAPADDLARDLAKVRTAEELAATKQVTPLAEPGRGHPPLGDHAVLSRPTRANLPHHGYWRSPTRPERQIRRAAGCDGARSRSRPQRGARDGRAPSTSFSRQRAMGTIADHCLFASAATDSALRRARQCRDFNALGSGPPRPRIPACHNSYRGTVQTRAGGSRCRDGYITSCRWAGRPWSSARRPLEDVVHYDTMA
jgi:hypothetical protein